jgi:hypothetical protein
MADQLLSGRICISSGCIIASKVGPSFKHVFKRFDIRPLLNLPYCRIAIMP